MANLGDNNTPVEGESFGLPSGFSIDEDSGNLAIRDTNGNVVAKWDEGNTQWDFANNTLNNVDALNSNSVNTDSAAINDVLDATGLTLSTDALSPTNWLSLVDGDREIADNGAITEDVAGDNSATDILDSAGEGAVYIVHGRREGDNTGFCDLVLALTRGDQASKIGSVTFEFVGSRSYEMESDTLQIVIDDAGETYNITTRGLGVHADQ